MTFIILKNIHLTCIALTFILFSVRGFWMLIESNKLQQKWVKIAPHIVDTFLLLIGVALAIKLQINPMEYLWLGEKLLAVVAYIFTGLFTLKLARNNVMRVIGYLGAMGWIMLVIRIAMTKQTVLLG